MNNVEHTETDAELLKASIKDLEIKLRLLHNNIVYRVSIGDTFSSIKATTVKEIEEKNERLHKLCEEFKKLTGEEYVFYSLEELNNMLRDQLK